MATPADFHTDALVGLSSFATSLGVDLSVEPQLDTIIEHCFRFCSETIDKARRQQSAQLKHSVMINASSEDHHPANLSTSSAVLEHPGISPIRRHSPPTTPDRSSSSHHHHHDGIVPPAHLLPQSPPQPTTSNSPVRGASATSSVISVGRSGTIQSPTPPVEQKLISPTRHNPQDPLDHRSVSPQERSTHPHLQGYADDVLDYARFVGADPLTEPWCLPIAKEGLYAPLPAGWRAVKAPEDGSTYYCNDKTGASSWEHPLDEEYRRRVADARAVKRKEALLLSAPATGRSELTAAQVMNNNNRSASVGSTSSSSAALAPPHKGVDDRVEAFGEYLGINVAREPHLLSIAREALLAPLPKEWKSYHDEEGTVYYVDGVSNETTWDHPLVDFYRRQVDEARKQRSPNLPRDDLANPPQQQQKQKQDSGTNNNASFSSVTASGGGGGRSTSPSLNSQPQQQQQDVVKVHGSVAPPAHSQEVIEYARFLGVEPSKEPHLMPIVMDGFNAPLPQGWSSYRSDDGTVYYANTSLGKSMWDHPLDEVYRHKVAEERKKLQK